MNADSLKTILNTEVAGCQISLLSEKAAYLPEFDALLIADAHLGKIDHFRKHGIAAPPGADVACMQRLERLIESMKPGKLVFMGDLFHSAANASWDLFSDFLKDFTQVKKILVKGNHDILPEEIFGDAGLHLVESLQLGPLLLSHAPVESNSYNIYGHIHPAIKLVGKGRVSLKLPCFILGNRRAILPSFGEFTGLALVKPSITDRTYAITPDAVFDVSASRD